TDEGRRQADELAAALSSEPVVGVYASRAIRAQQTAEPIAARHGLSVQVRDGLQEVFVGDLEAKTDLDSLRAFGEVFEKWAIAGDLSVHMPGGESAQEAVDRFTRAVREITADHDGGAVVVVSHGAMLRLAGPLLAGNLHTFDGELSRLQNTARIVL